MYPIHYTGVNLMNLNNKFGIKDATTKHISGDDIQNDPDMDYKSFTKAHCRSMTQVVWEYYCRICKIVCTVNAEALLNDVSGSLSELTTLEQQTYMVQYMVKMSS